jgi:tRNA (mo5U34)-methyltransferase
MNRRFSEIYLSADYLSRYARQLRLRKEIDKRRMELAPVLDKPSCEIRYRNIIKLPERQTSRRLYHQDTVVIGTPEELNRNERETLFAALKDLIPWRKGPFEYFGILVDAEWRSNLKWNRIQNYCDLKLSGLKVADVGCNNTYYMRRMLALSPDLVVGFDPMARYFFHHFLNQRFAREPNLAFELMGVDDLFLFPYFFDVIFLLGVIYHRRNPIHSLMATAESLKQGGQLIVESAGIPGDEPVCLFPEKRYMKAKGYWFLPTWKTLENMLARSGFTDIDTFHVFNQSINEQRRTDWAVFEALEDFLDTQDPSRTVEGYPAPVRIYTRARKK